MNFNKLLGQVDCHFVHLDEPYMSPASPDKMRFHVWDDAQKCLFMCDTEADLLGAIIHRHHLIIDQLNQRLNAPKEAMVSR